MLNNTRTPDMNRADLMALIAGCRVAAKRVQELVFLPHLKRAEEIIANPQHPYTRGLIAALPQMAGGEKRLNQIPGMMPSLLDMPKGCPFEPRCTISVEKCKTEIPTLTTLENGTQVACFMCEGGK